MKEKLALLMAEIEIAICTYNRSKQLDLCLTKLSNQTAAKEAWKVLVIDNASTDDTEGVVEKHQLNDVLPGLRRVYEKKPGLTSARQRAVRESQAAYIAFVDDDCHLAPDWIKQLKNAIERYPDAVALGGRVKPTWPEDIPENYKAHGWLFAEQPHGRPNEEGEFDSLVGAGLVLDRQALISTGWADQPLIEDRVGRGATSGGDVEISLRLKQAGGQLMYIPSMNLQHMIDPARQNFASMLDLSSGLGAGAALVSLMQSDEYPVEYFRSSISESRKRLRQLFVGLLRRHYSITDWRVYRAFEIGYLQNLKSTQSDSTLVARLTKHN